MLPAFLHFYPGLSKADFYALSLEEYGALVDYLNKYIEAMNVS